MKTKSNAFELKYSDQEFVLCANSFVPIYENEERVICPVCEANYKVENTDNVCSICLVGKIGMVVDGISRH